MYILHMYIDIFIIFFMYILFMAIYVLTLFGLK